MASGSDNTNPRHEPHIANKLETTQELQVEYVEPEVTERSELTMARERLELMKGVNTYQAPNIVAKIWGSHLYNVAAAALYLGKSIVCWTDADEVDLMFNEQCCHITTGRIWYDGNIKRRAFYGFKVGEVYFGLSPTIQSIEVVSDENLAKFGLVLEKQRYPWQPSDEPLITTLKFDIEKIIEKPYWFNLCQALDYTFPINDPEQEIAPVVIANILGLRAPEKFPDIYSTITYDELMQQFLNSQYYRPTTVYLRRTVPLIDI